MFLYIMLRHEFHMKLHLSKFIKLHTLIKDTYELVSDGNPFNLNILSRS